MGSPSGPSPSGGAPLPPDEVAGAPIVIGVAGGVASGKSTVARLLAGPRGRVLSADAMAQRVLESEKVRRKVREHFGEGVLNAAGLPDRERLAELVFDPEKGSEARRTLEGWIHPEVRARILDELSQARTDGDTHLVLDVPLLFENDAQHGLLELCDVVVFVDAKDEDRDRRARRARGWGSGEVSRRESAQFPIPDKRARADFVIPNHGSLEELERIVLELLPEIISS